MKKSYKITKLERNRKSILTEDLTRCYLCGRNKHHLHEVYFGKNRLRSMKYGCVVPLCYECHEMIHHNSKKDLELKQECRDKFLEVYECDIEDFIKIFGNSYKRQIIDI